MWSQRRTGAPCQTDAASANPNWCEQLWTNISSIYPLEVLLRTIERLGHRCSSPHSLVHECGAVRVRVRVGPVPLQRRRIG